MALGTIGILLIIVVGLASVYIRELKLSRTSYNDIIANAGAEWIFEYGMLKVRNHREGFTDSVTSFDPDGTMFSLSSSRSIGLKTSYTVRASSSDETFALAPNEHLIVPLFIANESTISGAIASKMPNQNNATLKTQWLTIQGLNSLSWTIVAMHGTENIGLTGSGDIIGGKEGIIRHKDTQCYDNNGNKLSDCSWINVAEELPYFWDEPVTVADFLSDSTTADPYIMIYNNNPTEQEVHITASTPFALPQMTIEATAQKNDSSQIFRFTEDKSRYYDALKYGVYNN